MPLSAVYILAEMYRYRVYKQNEIKSFCPSEQIFYNINYFINHFISMDSEHFLDDIRSMLYVKRYPFAIISRKLDYNNNFLVFGTKGKEEEYIIYNYEMALNKVNKIQLMNYYDREKVEWFVVIPPNKNMDKSNIMTIMLFKVLRYLLENYNILEESKSDFWHIQQMMSFLKYFQEQWDGIWMSKHVSAYQNLMEECFDRKDIIMGSKFLYMEHDILKQLYDEIAKRLNK